MANTRCVWAWGALTAFLFSGGLIAGAEPAPKPVKPFRYVVRTGDTPSQLAQRWGLTQAVIAKPGHVLKTGEVVTIPLAARAKVRRGGSLSELSKKYGISVERLAKFNQIPPPYRLKAGQVIMVPK